MRILYKIIFSFIVIGSIHAADYNVLPPVTIDPNYEENKAVERQLEEKRVEEHIQDRKLEDQQVEERRLERAREDRKADDKAWDRSHGRIV